MDAKGNAEGQDNCISMGKLLVQKINDVKTPYFLPEDPPPDVSFIGFFLSLARYVFNFSALSRYDTHFARIDSFARSLCASSVTEREE